MERVVITLDQHKKLESGDLLGTAVDITAIKNREESNFWLTRELMHRIRNLLTVLQSMARHSSKEVYTSEVFVERFIDRLHGLSKVHDLLITTSYVSVDMTDLIQSQIAELPAATRSRFQLSGGKFSLNPDAAQAFGLAFHELVDNACRHGSIRSQNGKVDISWGRSQGKVDLLKLQWIETGSTPIQMSPDGFGMFLIKRNLPRLMNGEIRVSYLENRFECMMEFPVERIVASSVTQIDV